MGGGFSMFIAKGNEGDTGVYAPLNDTVVKSGYWIGENSQMIAMAEVINYKNIPQEVYLSIDLEYSTAFKTRSQEYLDVGFGTFMVLSCDAANPGIFPLCKV